MTSGFDPALHASAVSLAPLEEDGETPADGGGEVRFRFVNHTASPLRARLDLTVPRGYRAGEGTGGGEVAPGAETIFAFPLAAPEGTSGKVRAEARLHLERDGKEFAFRRAAVFVRGAALVSILDESIDAAEGTVRFRVENRSPRALGVRLWCRVLLGDGRDGVDSREVQIAPSERRPAELSLGAPARELEGKELLLGAEILGRGETITGRYRLEPSRGRLLPIDG